MKTLRLWILALAALLALALPATALANSSNDGYGGPNNVVSGIQGGGNDEEPPAPDEASSSPAPESEVLAVSAQNTEESGGSELPFTGLDVGLLLVAGGLFVLLGFGLRRFTRPAQ